MLHATHRRAADRAVVIARQAAHQVPRPRLYVDRCEHRAVIRSGCSAPVSGVVIDRGRRSGGVGGDVVLSDLSDQRVADEDVVDQFLASPIDAAEALGFGDAWGQIPQPLSVAVVGLVEAAGADL